MSITLQCIQKFVVANVLEKNTKNMLIPALTISYDAR